MLAKISGKAVRTDGPGRGGLGRAVGGAPLQGRMGYLSFRRFRLRAMGTDGFAVIRCVAGTGEVMIFAVLSFMLFLVLSS